MVRQVHLGETVRQALKRPLPAFISGLFVVGLVGALDWVIKSEISVSALYLVPVGFVAWNSGKPAALVMAAVAAFVWFLAEYYGRAPLVSLSASLWQSLSRLIFYVVAATLVARVRVLTLYLETLVRERTEALEAEILRRKELEAEASDVAEGEQQRVANELHDQLAAYLSGLAFRIAALRDALAARHAPEEAMSRELVSLVNGATTQVRNLAHLLAPSQEEESLEVALSRMAEQFETVFGITCIVELAKDLPPQPRDRAVQLCRIAHEAVRNGNQHGQAQLIRIVVEYEPPSVILTIRSDGRHWKPIQASPTGLGLRIMRYRSEQLGGSLSISSPAEGGTVVRCVVPAQATPAARRPGAEKKEFVL